MTLPVTRALALGVGLILLASTALAHITPPVVLASDREVLLSFLAGSRKFFVREVRLSAQERQALRQQVGWNPDEDFYRFYLGRNETGGLVAATVFLTEYTIHGPVRVAVALGPDGKVKGARVVEVTEETYPWVKPLIDSHGTFELAKHSAGHGETMTQFYGQIVASLVQRAAALYDVALGKPAADAGDAASRRG